MTQSCEEPLKWAVKALLGDEVFKGETNSTTLLIFLFSFLFLYSDAQRGL